MIIGAGFAGLIAAHVLKREPIFESAAAPLQGHRALLRFRTDAVSKLTGIEFRKVLVHKGIYFNNYFVEPNIHHANAYSRKCLGAMLSDRSIWNVQPVERFIAPDTFYEQLLENVGDRINWGIAIEFTPGMAAGEAIISTAPLHVPAQALSLDLNDEKFAHAEIYVARYHLKNFDVHQTIYFPTPAHSLYRASITGNTLICEFAGEPRGEWDVDLNNAFCLYSDKEMFSLETTRQRYGKIAPINEATRRRLVHDLTAHFGIFSIGRFATWRNILLDDIVHDAEIVKMLIGATRYERRIASL